MLRALWHAVGPTVRGLNEMGRHPLRLQPNIHWHFENREQIPPAGAEELLDVVQHLDTRLRPGLEESAVAGIVAASTGLARFCLSSLGWWFPFLEHNMSAEALLDGEGGQLYLPRWRPALGAALALQATMPASRDGTALATYFWPAANPLRAAHEMMFSHSEFVALGADASRDFPRFIGAATAGAAPRTF